MELKSKLLATTVLAGVIALAPMAHAQPASIGIPTVSRLVKIFYGQEDRLTTALHARDATTIDHLLAEDFEMRIAANPGAPVARADFLRQLKSETLPAYPIEQMAVHEIGAVWIVSYLMRPAGTSQPLFIVDIWSGTLESPRLSIRYSAPSTSARTPGATEIPQKNIRDPAY